MVRYVLDAPTLLHIVAEGAEVHADHRLVAEVLVRSQAPTLLLGAARLGELTDQVAVRQHESG